MTVKKICLSTAYFNDAVKHVGGSKVRIAFTKDGTRVKIDSQEDCSFVYLMQAMFDSET